MFNSLCSCFELSGAPTRQLSTRGLEILQGTDSAYYLGWKEYEKNPFHPVSNPKGCIQLGLAESKLSLDLLQGWMHAHPEAMQLQLHEVAGYPNYAGLPSLRNAFGSFMQEVMKTKQEFDPESIVLTAGATAAIEVLSFCLAEPGDAFLVPAPYYPGFTRDCRWRSNVELVPVPCFSSNNFNITGDSLTKAMKQASKDGKRVRGLLISSPSNPVGNTIEPGVLEMVLDFIREYSIHLICDEIYAGSTFTLPEFISIASLVEDSDFKELIRDKVHIVYGVSKDLGLAGFRVGVLHSWNKQVISAATRLARFCAVSTQTQTLLGNMLSDRDFMRGYLEENKVRLKERWDLVSKLLGECGIGFARGNAGFYCWIDLRRYMKQESEDGELEIWEKLLYDLGLNLTPGQACSCPEPGWFRLCFANLDEDTLLLALDRFKRLKNH